MTLVRRGVSSSSDSSDEACAGFPRELPAFDVLAAGCAFCLFFGVGFLLVIGTLFFGVVFSLPTAFRGDARLVGDGVLLGEFPFVEPDTSDVLKHKTIHCNFVLLIKLFLHLRIFSQSTAQCLSSALLARRRFLTHC